MRWTGHEARMEMKIHTGFFRMSEERRWFRIPSRGWEDNIDLTN
jgi:hypothetical protein